MHNKKGKVTFKDETAIIKPKPKIQRKISSSSSESDISREENNDDNMNEHNNIQTTHKDEENLRKREEIRSMAIKSKEKEEEFYNVLNKPKFKNSSKSVASDVKDSKSESQLNLTKILDYVEPNIKEESLETIEHSKKNVN